MYSHQGLRAPLDRVPDHLTEVLFGPDDHRWDEVRQAWNLTVDQRPAAVGVARTADDVIALVRWGSDAGLRISAQGTGHAAAAHASLDGVLLIRTAALNDVQIDAEQRRARVGAGTVWRDVSVAAGEFGLATLAGSGPDVGVVGYTLGGGVSWLGRRYGLAANSVLAVELVTAHGELVRADRHHDPDLFWALRGGGGAFGVVTAVEFELFPVADVYAGTLFWPVERAATVLTAWRDWTGTSPIELTSCARLLNFPPLPDLPEQLRARSFIAIEVAYLGDPAAAVQDLRPLRALNPQLDTVVTMPVAQLGGLHMDPDRPVPGTGNGGLLADLPDEAIAALLDVAGPGTRSPLLSVEIRHLGGALAVADDGCGALASIEAPYGTYAVGMAVTPELKGAIDARIDALSAALSPWHPRHGYLNFDDRPGPTERLFPAQTYQRLRDVKAAYDPDDLFQSNHPIPPSPRMDV